MQTELKQQVVYFGEGALTKVAAILDRLSAHSVFLVADEPAYSASGAVDELEHLLAERKVERFLGFRPNPKLEDIVRGIEQFRSSSPEIVIAIGGGTAMDLAKLIGVLSAQQAGARDIITGGGAIEVDGPPLVALPTTAGTGSEATHFAVAYIDGRKYSVANPRLLPDYVAIDPRFTHSLPTQIAMASGLDAFCQSVESIWAVGATEESICYASESVRLAIEHLPKCVADPTAESRAAMCRAAHLSGKAINISKTTASHAISYAMTIRYGIPHGMAVALTLGQMLQFNALVTESDCSDPRGADHVQARINTLLELFGQATAAGGAGKIRELMISIGAPVLLREVGIDMDDSVAWIAEQVNVERLGNNPRRISKQEIEEMLKGLL
jgi:alcohol dehydrogenase class IV